MTRIKHRRDHAQSVSFTESQLCDVHVPTTGRYAVRILGCCGLEVSVKRSGVVEIGRYTEKRVRSEKVPREREWVFSRDQRGNNWFTASCAQVAIGAKTHSCLAVIDAGAVFIESDVPLAVVISQHVITVFGPAFRRRGFQLAAKVLRDKPTRSQIPAHLGGPLASVSVQDLLRAAIQCGVELRSPRFVLVRSRQQDVWGIETSGRLQYFLKRWRAQTSKAEVCAELTNIQGAPFAAWSIAGAPRVAKLAGQYAYVELAIDGSRMPASWAARGRMLATFHARLRKLEERLSQTQRTTLHVGWGPWQFDLCALHLRTSLALVRADAANRQRWDRIWRLGRWMLEADSVGIAARVRWQLIHGDLSEANCRVERGTRLRAFDLETIRLAPLVWEFGPFLTGTGNGEAARYVAGSLGNLVDAYEQSARTCFSDDERRLLGIGAISCMCNALFVGVSRKNAGGMEIKRLLRQIEVLTKEINQLVGSPPELRTCSQQKYQIGFPVSLAAKGRSHYSLWWSLTPRQRRKAHARARFLQKHSSEWVKWVQHVVWPDRLLHLSVFGSWPYLLPPATPGDLDLFAIVEGNRFRLVERQRHGCPPLRRLRGAARDLFHNLTGVGVSVKGVINLTEGIIDPAARETWSMQRNVLERTIFGGAFRHIQLFGPRLPKLQPTPTNVIAHAADLVRSGEHWMKQTRKVAGPHLAAKLSSRSLEALAFLALIGRSDTALAEDALRIRSVQEPSHSVAQSIKIWQRFVRHFRALDSANTISRTS